MSINSLRTEVDAQMVAETEANVETLTLLVAKSNRDIFELTSKNCEASMAASWKQ